MWSGPASASRTGAPASGMWARLGPIGEQDGGWRWVASASPSRGGAPGGAYGGRVLPEVVSALCRRR